jgi:predicted amidohydrolase
MKHPLTLALYQCPPGPLAVDDNLQRLNLAAQQARQRGADVLVCPEMFLTGYAIGAPAVQQLAQPADGAYANAVAAIARQQNLAVVYGYPERDAQGVVFNAAQWISASGERGLNYRKTHLFGALDRNQFSPGDPGYAEVELKGWRISLLICYDVEFPENTRRLALAGADLIVVPTANMSDYNFVAQAVVPVRAFENQVYVAYANYIGQEANLHYGGLSNVAGPDGHLLAQAGPDQQQLLLVTLDGAQLQTARQQQTHLAEAAAYRAACPLR